MRRPTTRRRFVAFPPRTTCLVALLFFCAAPRIEAADTLQDAALQAPPAQAQKLSRDWRRFESPNFVMFGNASQDYMRRALTELEAFRALLLQMFPTLRLSSPVPTRVLVFKDEESFSPFKPRDERGRRQEWAGGYFAALPDVNYMVIAAQRGELEFQPVFHEYTHYVLALNLQTMPLWLGEGIADFYSTFRPTPEKGGSLVGTPPRGRVLQMLYGGSLIPLERMFSTEGALRIFQNPSEVGKFYAESWALVHYIYLGQKGKRQGQLGTYVRAIQKGLPVEQAFKESFHCTYDQLESELRDYVNKFDLRVLTIRRPPNPAAENAETQPMLQADADALQADLLTRVGSEADAERAARRALSLQPAHPQAELALATVRQRQDRLDEAIPLLQGLTEKPGVSFAACLALVSALTTAGRAEEALGPALRAATLNEQSPTAWFNLSLVQVALDRDAEADVSMRRLLELDASPDCYRRRAYAAFNLGKDAAATRDARRFLERADVGDESAAYAAFLAALAHRRLGQDAEADAVLQQAVAGVQRGSWTEKVLSYLQRRLTANELLAQASDNGQKTEAHTYVGFHLAIAGSRGEAITHLKWVKDEGSRNYVEYPMAVSELKRLERAAAPPR